MENVLHIFLDTNILENDPFLQQVVNLKLLVKHGKAEILLPDVVIDELIKHTIKKTKEAINNLKKSINSLKHFQVRNVPDFQVSVLTQSEIRDKYAELQSTELIKILSSDNIKVSRIMQRYISEQKPFSENKESFRDYVLFCTCADYVYNNNLTGCYFISDNSHDFANKDKTDFHDDLKAESQGMKYVKGLRKFYELPEIRNIINELKREEKYESLVENWIYNYIQNPLSRTDESITDWAIKNIKESEYLENLFNNKLYNSIENEIINKCMNLYPENVGSFYDAGYVDYEGIDTIEKIDISDFTASEDKSVTISGNIKLDVQVSIYVINWSYERNDEDDSKYICLESGNVKMDYYFDLTLKDDGFEVDYNLETIKSDLGENYSE